MMTLDQDLRDHQFEDGVECRLLWESMPWALSLLPAREGLSLMRRKKDHPGSSQNPFKSGGIC